uniref:RRM domain-containing protein n=1 Tax=Periophthalmus magnuspinnatus TaxID=409849 RepID=A0A3B3ZBN6_9GOBI
MSYPPQQISIQPLPPGVPPTQFGAYAPPIPPGNYVLITTPVTIVQKPVLTKPGSDAAKSNDADDAPTTTVFVGNISDKVSDLLVRQLLAVLGSVSTKNQNLPSVRSDFCMSYFLETKSFW